MACAGADGRTWRLDVAAEELSDLRRLGRRRHNESSEQPTTKLLLYINIMYNG